MNCELQNGTLVLRQFTVLYPWGTIPIFKHRNRHKEIVGDQLTGLKMVYIKYFDAPKCFDSQIL